MARRHGLWIACRVLRRLVALLALLAVSALVVVPATSGPATARRGGGTPPVVLWPGDDPYGDMPKSALISVSRWGLRFVAGKQDTHLTVTEVGENKLMFRDTGTRKWRSLAHACQRVQVKRGVAAICRIPPKFRDDKRMFLEIWPRLGDDTVDMSTLPRRYRAWVLVDAGRDIVAVGAGNDFVNGAKGNDLVHAGAGSDWVRTGPGNDRLWGEAGNDELKGVDNNDFLPGGTGADEVDGGPGRDRRVVDRSDNRRNNESRRRG